MASYSKEELQYIASQVQPYLLELVKSNGLDVDSVEIVEDTDGITSLPAYDNRGGVKKIVRVPLSSFSKPAQDAANELAESIAKAAEAAENANAAADAARTAAEGIEADRQAIEQAVSDAQKALEDVRESADVVTEKVEEINASESARVEAEQARRDAEDARAAEYSDLKSQMSSSIEEMDVATESAVDTADHPTQIGDDYYVYRWNKETRVYDRTDIYVKGDRGEQGLQGEQGPRGPKGENGMGSGNVLVAEEGLLAGKTYLFTPSQDGSAEGAFVEYEVPKIDLTEVATKEEVASKQESIGDLDDIRSGAALGATAVQPSELADVARSGSYNDLKDKPTIPGSVTESTVSGWGFTKNAGTITGVSANGTSVATNGVANIPAASTSAYGVTKLSSSTSSTSTALAATASAVKEAYDLANSYKGTVTGVKINGTTKTPTSGTVDLGTVITAHQDISGKQDSLVSGTNIKTVNGQSLLGEGDIAIETGGVSVPVVDHGTDDTTFTLTPNVLHKWGRVTSLTLALEAPADTTVANYYMLQFTSGSTATTLSFPDTVRWISAVRIGADKTYQVSIFENLGVIGGA